MGITFNASEILEMAIEIERNGQKFYKKAAQIIKDARVRSFLSDIADMEAEHEKTFRQMKEGLSQKEVQVFDPDNEATLYLEAMADGNIFDLKKDLSKKLDEGQSLDEIFRLAIQAEKDSIIYYIGLEDYVPLEADKARVDKIIEEEKGHILTLYQNLRKYQ